MRRRAMGFGGGVAPLACAALLALACGGRVDGSADDSGEPGPPQDPTPTSATAGSDGAGFPAASDNPDTDTELGECMLGPLESSYRDKSCAWVSAGRCYAKRATACNCACPRTHDSQCVSGFEAGPNGHVWVACG